MSDELKTGSHTFIPNTTTGKPPDWMLKDQCGNTIDVSDSRLPVNIGDGEGTIGGLGAVVFSKQILEPKGYTGPDLHGKGKCGVCKKQKKPEEIAFSYGLKKVARFICNSCYVKKLDKQFGIKHTDLEDVLY